MLIVMKSFLLTITQYKNSSVAEYLTTLINIARHPQFNMIPYCNNCSTNDSTSYPQSTITEISEVNISVNVNSFVVLHSLLILCQSRNMCLLQQYNIGDVEELFT